MTDKEENLKELEFLEKDGSPFVFDHKASKLYAMTGGKRREITNSESCARIRSMASVISEEEAKRLSFPRADEYWEKAGLLTLVWRWARSMKGSKKYQRNS